MIAAKLTLHHPPLPLYLNQVTCDMVERSIHFLLVRTLTPVPTYGANSTGIGLTHHGSDQNRSQSLHACGSGSNKCTTVAPWQMEPKTNTCVTPVNSEPQPCLVWQVAFPAFEVYCYSLDDEIPSFNTVTSSQMLATERSAGAPGPLGPWAGGQGASLGLPPSHGGS